jgi:hypothetical protein
VKLPTIITVADLLRAMNAGWELHDTPADALNGFHSSSSEYSLRRNGYIRRGINGRAVSMAIRTNRIEIVPEMKDETHSVWRVKRVAKRRRI